ncbi:6-phosphogluconate dehydrogenase, NADP(+)-dependent, decarboxylating [Fundidesulfovibrio magnetotacticus]|uniref:6-phosphogluconate dehydrogenase, decarboxylating n=1 Tax=Fundidesulfovibrio magnetotacticus TaxID=2730080 RepID=A0A6V8LX58_9BACT|nr:NADP-dependent phosphogluconate dehydrogenase [Fundidesulfovibrio magnetotacticus]GFK94386.1 6-phosphogluconate dehydrogenase, NADP(+)-dependent, decarboxylating [Fundidesulfovibrio magnetotacticus]
MSTCDIALVGLAVMGQNLALNMASRGFSAAVFNRTESTTREFMDRAGNKAGLKAAFSPAEAVGMLSSPRKIFLMVKAGSPVDQVIDEFVPLLSPGDILVDGGNSHFPDTVRRTRELAAKGIRYLGVGVSGGEEGALHGPSIMPGGEPEAWPFMEPILTAISAKAGPGGDEPCVAWMGNGGAGHYVKMVHNGIEYGDMQLIAEVYDILGRAGGLDAAAQARVFSEWNKGPLASYLVEITAQALSRIDEETSKPLVDVILDAAGQKGTGRWTAESALELGIPIPTLTSAVEARGLSSLKEQRVRASRILQGGCEPPAVNVADLVRDAEQALYAAKVCSYAQGFALLAEADKVYGFGLDLGQAAKVWRAGCIIRADFLDDVTAAFKADPALENLLEAPVFTNEVGRRLPALRRLAGVAIASGIPAPALCASLAYYDGFRSEHLPANLIQAQRDLFGAHTFKRLDKEGVFHAQW